MQHRRSRIRLNEKPDHARQLARNLVTSLLLYEAIRTTKKRAKVIQPMVDRLIATARRSSPRVAIRAINRVVTDKNASRKVMEVLIKRYEKRSSGFTTVTPAGSRKGDGAALVDLQLIDSVVQDKSTSSAKKPRQPRKSSVSSDSSESSVSSPS